LFDQTSDTIWRKRDALLARSGFRWDADFLLGAVGWRATGV